MRTGALIPALALGAALLAPPLAAADHHRAPENGRRSGYDRSPRSQGRYERSHSRRAYRRDFPRDSYRRGHHRPVYRHRRPYYRPPRYYRPDYRSYYYGAYRPYPRPYYYVPAPPPYGPWPRYRGGVHGHVSLGLPFIGFSLHF
jgi:hypothetical protein